MTTDARQTEGTGFRAMLRKGDWRSYVIVAALSSLGGPLLIMTGLTGGTMIAAALVSGFSGLLTWYGYCYANGWGFDE